MSTSAKQQIVSAFLGLLAEKPLDKLTVTDIVAASGVTRQSFYYHFQDIPDLIAHVVQGYTDTLCERAVRTPDTRETIRVLMAPLWDCPELARRLLDSRKYDVDQIIYTEVYGHLVRLFRLRRMEIGMGHQGMETAAAFYANAAIGIVGLYCRRDSVDQDVLVEQLYRLVRGDMFRSQPSD